MKYKNLWRRKRIKREIFRNVSLSAALTFSLSAALTLCATRLLGRCETCKGSFYTKNEYNLFYQYHKLDVEYFVIRQFFRKKQYFPRKPWKIVLIFRLTNLQGQFDPVCDGKYSFLYSCSRAWWPINDECWLVNCGIQVRIRIGSKNFELEFKIWIN